MNVHDAIIELLSHKQPLTRAELYALTDFMATQQRFDNALFDLVHAEAVNEFALNGVATYTLNERVGSCQLCGCNDHHLVIGLCPGCRPKTEWFGCERASLPATSIELCG